MGRDISKKDTKLLCLKSGGICAFPNCRKSLIQEETDKDNPVITGEIAHIVAYEPGGPRGDATFPKQELNKHTNLILLCGDHHKLIDSQPNTYSIRVLQAMKQDHEATMRSLHQPENAEPPVAVIKESLHSSLLAVSYLPAVVFAASSEYNDRQKHEVRERIKYPSDRWELTPFLLREGHLFAFHDLQEEENPFRSVISNRDIQIIPAQELWSSAEGKRRYQALLNYALIKYTTGLNLQYDPAHRRYFFPAAKNKDERTVIYRPLNQNQSKRKVAWPQKQKATGKNKNLWIHLATSLRFHEVAPLRWCLSIRPERHFTSDGCTPLPPKQIGRRSTRLKARMYNHPYLSEVHFWRDYLSRGKPQIILNFRNQSVVIDTTQLLTFEIEWPGIAEDTKPFNNQVCNHDLFSYSELMQAIEGEDRDCQDTDEDGEEELDDE
ncbi:HNH endonuclease [Oscillatoriales cyanobacterium LEGE 11467]|uniref:HNH endonuclease n=1 Tax=Zarconia navalis LEGE 11467 TaxID=1828826 RepID=A0A928VVZ3_9CYAN|nr:HNH endonuclease [Zarconia navalis]MBE9039737.1 HNH endonuclease [Zarconia navalis LEGE 11467]